MSNRVELTEKYEEYVRQSKDDGFTPMDFLEWWGENDDDPDDGNRHYYHCDYADGKLTVVRVDGDGNNTSTRIITAAELYRLLDD